MSSPDGGRRGLILTAAGAGLLLGAGLLVPALGALVHPLRRKTVSGGLGEWLEVARADELRAGRPVRKQVRATVRDGWARFQDLRLGSVWLERLEGGELRAFSAACPHLSCGVGLARGGKGYWCACHDSHFGEDGAALSGPSPRGLDGLEVREADGRVQVRFQRFKADVEEKIPI